MNLSMLSSPSFTPSVPKIGVEVKVRGATASALPAVRGAEFRTQATPSTNQTVRVTSKYSATALSADFSARVRNMLTFKNDDEILAGISNKITGMKDMASFQAKQDAATFAKVIASCKGLSAPHVALASDGEINFFWKSSKGHVDLGFYGDQKYSFYAVVDGREYFGDDIPASSMLPEEIRKAFSK